MVLRGSQPRPSRWFRAASSQTPAQGPAASPALPRHPSAPLVRPLAALLGRHGPPACRAAGPPLPPSPRRPRAPQPTPQNGTACPQPVPGPRPPLLALPCGAPGPLRALSPVRAGGTTTPRPARPGPRPRGPRSQVRAPAKDLLDPTPGQWQGVDPGLSPTLDPLALPAQGLNDLGPKKWTTVVTIWPCLLGARHAKALPRRASAPSLRADARR